MPDEQPGRRHVTPPCRRRPQAEIVLLAVSTPEALAVESADLIEAAPADRHAESHTRRNLDGRHVECRAQLIPSRDPVIGQETVVAQRRGIAEDGRGVGKRRRRRRARRSQRRHQAVEPIAEHLRVRIQQDDIAVGMGGKAAIDGLHEAEIALVHEQGDQASRRQRLQFATQRWIGRCVVDHHQFVGLARFGPEHAVDRLQRERTAAVYGHDHIDLCRAAIGAAVREQTCEVERRRVLGDLRVPPLCLTEPQPVREGLIPLKFDIRIETAISRRRKIRSGRPALRRSDRQIMKSGGSRGRKPPSRHALIVIDIDRATRKAVSNTELVSPPREDTRREGSET